MLVYSCNAVIGWRYPNLVPARFSGKKKDQPRLIWWDVLLTVEGNMAFLDHLQLMAIDQELPVNH